MPDSSSLPVSEPGRMPEEIAIAIQNFEIWAKAWGDAQGDPPTEANVKQFRATLNATILRHLSGAFSQANDWRALAEAAQTARADELAKLGKLHADLAAAVILVGEHARVRGEAEGKMRAAKWPGIVDGWRDRAMTAEAERDALAAELYEALHGEEPEGVLQGLKVMAEARDKAEAERDALRARAERAEKALEPFTDPQLTGLMFMPANPPMDAVPGPYTIHAPHLFDAARAALAQAPDQPAGREALAQEE